MIKVIALIVLLTFCCSKQKQVYQLLQRTQSINYTFYHLHQYPSNDLFGLLISIKQLDTNPDQVRQRINQNYDKILTSIKPYGFEANITSKSEDYGEKCQIQWTLEIKTGRNITALQSFLDEFAMLSKNNNSLFIWSVFRHGREIIDKELQRIKARETATFKSKQICEERIGWSFQQIAVFDEIVIQNKKAENVIVGDYLQEQEQSDAQSTIYKCQIVCQRKNSIEYAVIQKTKNRSNKRTSKQKKKANKKEHKKQKKDKKRAKTI